MKIIRFPLLLISFILCWQGNLFGQPKKLFDPINSDISNYIPPLSALLDSAILHNPNVAFRDLQTTINNCKFRAAQIDWTKNIGFLTDIRYGTFDNYSTDYTGGTGPVNNMTTRTELRWGYGAYISLPIFTVMNRRNLVRISKYEMEQAKSMADAQRSELTQEIIRQYNDLILKQRLLRIKSKSFETARINLQMAEKEFSNGSINVTELSQISMAVSGSESDFETARMDLLTAYLILEELVGIKFNLTNSIQGTNEVN
ncbi:MAG: TolC family protein [Bacteroidota bacterium]